MTRLLAAAWALVLALAACEAPAAEDTAGPGAQVVLLAPAGEVVVGVEVADSDAERAVGLMYRKELAADRGMLFIFPKEEPQQFWMQNTYIPLDMIFIDSAGAVVGVVHEATPLTTTARRVDGASKYVLEVNGGFAARHGIEAGTKVAFRNVALEAAE